MIKKHLYKVSMDGELLYYFFGTEKDVEKECQTYIKSVTYEKFRPEEYLNEIDMRHRDKLET